MLQFLHDQDFYPNIHHTTSTTPSHEVALEFAESLSGNNTRWTHDILLEAARATAERNTSRAHQLIWILNELSSPYGDTHQKLASYFLQALFCRMTHSGHRTRQALLSASDKMRSFDSTRNTLLKFQEVSPWTTFGHVASNGAIMEAFEGQTRLHIVDLSNTFCTQWPTLLEAIATRADDTPHLRITAVVSSSVERVMKEIATRMEKFARLMRVPLEFHVVYHVGDLSELDVRDEEALAVNCVGTLHSVGDRRDALVSIFRSLSPKYREGWAMAKCSSAGIFLSWKDQPVVWASAWRPS